MLQINNLKLIHELDYRVLVDGLTFSLNPGDKIVIIGEEGEGKSTLLKWIYEPELIREYARAEGTCGKKDEKIGYLPQELSEGDRKLTVYEFMCTEHLFTTLSPRDVIDIERQVRLGADFFYSDQVMDSLSGGEKVKVQMARIIAGKPTIFLLDEPSNDIDIATLEWLEDFILSKNEGIIFVSHDETLIENTANRVIHIEQLNHKTLPRHTVANMPYREYIRERFHNFELQESRAKLERREQKNAEEKWRRIYQRVEHEQNTITRKDPSGGRLLKKKMHAVKSQGRRLEKRKDSMTDIPHFERAIKLDFDYVPMPKKKEVLSIDIPELKVLSQDQRILSTDIKLKLRGDEKVLIIGNNGAGKTTLLKQIRDELLNKDVKIAYMPQNYEEILDFNLTPMEFLSKSGDNNERVLINNRLASLRFTPDDMKRRIGDLSGGQRAKLLLLYITLSEADVLIMDEPTRNLSPLSGPIIRNMLKSFPGCIIAVSHDRKFIDEIADTVYELNTDGLRVL